MSGINSLNEWMITAAISMVLTLITGCSGASIDTQSQPPAVTAPSVSVPAAGTGSTTSQPKQGQTGAVNTGIPYTQEVFASKLNVPWDMDIAPDGRIFFTERGGIIRVIDKGKLMEQPVYRFEKPFLQEGESGLLGLVLDKDFATNHAMYVYHTYEEGGGTRNQVLRMIESNNRLQLDKVIIDKLPGARTHDGGRVKIGPDGMLYITSGDAGQSSIAQDLSQLGGKILRIHPDGTIPRDNPFPDSPVYSLGHRNPQGLAWHPVTGKLFSTEHGQSAHDEFNLIDPGANYGWPLIEGDESEVADKDKSKLGPGTLKLPLVHSGNETWAPSGITFVTKGPWKGNLLAANLRGAQLLRVVLGSDQQSIQQLEPLLKNELGRIRNVMEGPDGSIYIMTNNRDGRGTPGAADDQIIRLKPNF
ncbi:sorbosone dehydrogenase family protein [Paenibacillus sp. FSL H7-0331]|uniref:PQQ-dependent sugar dehydrogenase n=1 Tax=Paenibacillus sp. FSL H7-0331 TaxID=1920421 RepID=UPI00096DAC62|nr:PQQ-dependent sugar dehydrogenase [Paenibacillus sp. FSL H7-0331]OMF07095.1 glucose sorbosone dehydrogenase [Paenibacillus sp. FSL H7-0331]